MAEERIESGALTQPPAGAVPGGGTHRRIAGAASTSAPVRPMATEKNLERLGSLGKRVRLPRDTVDGAVVAEVDEQADKFPNARGTLRQRPRMYVERDRRAVALDDPECTPHDVELRALDVDLQARHTICQGEVRVDRDDVDLDPGTVLGNEAVAVIARDVGDVERRTAGS